MREHRLAVVTATATFALLVIGGLVHATGSSLACPDWPLCGGQVFPAMVGGVLFEHGHRLTALIVAVLTVWLTVEVWRTRQTRAERGLAAAALVLVLIQASLGAITVLLRLPLLVSAAHLATSMAFFVVVIVLAFRLRPPALPEAGPLPAPGLARLSAILVYVQIVLGALVRHASAGLACNDQILLCDGQLWPSSGPGQLHMVHRLFALVVAGVVIAAAWAPLRAARRNGDRALFWVAAAGPALVLAQIGAGLLVVLTFISIPVVTLHLALGALLLADTLSLHLLLAVHLKPPQKSSGTTRAGFAPAAG